METCKILTEQRTKAGVPEALIEEPQSSSKATLASLHFLTSNMAKLSKTYAAYAHCKVRRSNKQLTQATTATHGYTRHALSVLSGEPVGNARVTYPWRQSVLLMNFGSLCTERLRIAHDPTIRAEKIRIDDQTSRLQVLYNLLTLPNLLCCNHSSIKGFPGKL